MTAVPHPLALDRRRGARSAVSAWGAAAAYPVLLYVAVLDLALAPTALQAAVPAALGVLLVGLLRRHPVPGAALLLAGALAACVLLPSWPVGYAQTLAVSSGVGLLAATRRRRLSVPVAAAAVAGHAAGAAYYTAGSDEYARAVVIAALATGCAWAVGHSVRERRRHAEALRAEATARAVAAERLRIARDVHDLVAHSIGTIAIQAGAGARVADSRPDQARTALAAIEATSRETLSGLRRTLGVLRGADGTAVPLAPAPGLADLDRLVAAAADAGVRVEVDQRGAVTRLPADLDLAAYRILQEAVTNVVRHAGVDRCRVTIDRPDGALSIEVLDDGRGCLVGGHGFGLVGMRERVASLHGTLTVGPRPDGGFRVVARLPVPADAG